MDAILKIETEETREDALDIAVGYSDTSRITQQDIERRLDQRDEYPPELLAALRESIATCNKKKAYDIFREQFQDEGGFTVDFDSFWEKCMLLVGNEKAA